VAMSLFSTSHAFPLTLQPIFFFA